MYIFNKWLIMRKPVSSFTRTHGPADRHTRIWQSYFSLETCSGGQRMYVWMYVQSSRGNSPTARWFLVRVHVRSIQAYLMRTYLASYSKLLNKRTKGEPWGIPTAVMLLRQARSVQKETELSELDINIRKSCLWNCF